MKFDPPFVFSLFVVRSTLVLIVGLLLGFALRRKNPAGAKLALRTALALSLLCVFLPTSFKAAHAPIFNVAPPVPADPPSYQSDSSSPASVPVQAKAPTPEDAVLQRLSPKSFPVEPEVAHPAPRLTPIVCWAIGMGIGLVLNVFGVLLLGIIGKQGKPFHDLALLKRLEYTSDRLGIALPRLKSSRRVDTPCVAGIVRPTIYIPEASVTSLEPLDLQTLILHEMIHVRNRDCLWNLLSRLVASVLWFNPLVWVVSRQLVNVTEEVCDAGVIESGLSQGDYANSLVSIAKKIQANPMRLNFGPGIFESESSLGKRLRKILSPNWRVSSKASAGSKLFVYIGVAAAALAGGFAVAGVGTEPFHEVPYFRSQGPFAKPPPSDPGAVALLTEALDKPTTLSSIQGTINFFPSNPKANEICRITRSNSEDLGRVDVLREGKAKIRQAFVDGKKDYVLFTDDPEKVVVYDSSGLATSERPAPDNLELNWATGLSLRIAGFKSHPWFTLPRPEPYNSVSFGPDANYEGRPASTVYVDYPSKTRHMIWRYTIQKEGHFLREVAERSDKAPNYFVEMQVSYASYNRPIDPKDLTFHQAPGMKVVVTKVKAYQDPKPTKREPVKPRDLTPLETQIVYPFEVSRQKLVDEEVVEQFDPADPNKVTRAEHRLTGVVGGQGKEMLTLEDISDPSNSGTMWTDGAYIWVTRKQNPSKYLKLVADSQGRAAFGGLNDPADFVSVMGDPGRYQINFSYSKLLSTTQGRLNGQAVDYLKYQVHPDQPSPYGEEMVVVESQGHRIREIIDSDFDSSRKHILRRTTERLTYFPLASSPPASTFTFQPAPGMIQVDTAGELR